MLGAAGEKESVKSVMRRSVRYCCFLALCGWRSDVVAGPSDDDSNVVSVKRRVSVLTGNKDDDPCRPNNDVSPASGSSR